VNGVCGQNPADCYLERGCQSAFGICTSQTNLRELAFDTNNTDEPARTPRLMPGRTVLTPEEAVERYQRALASRGRRVDVPAQ
jgi:hypothetical protein